MATYPRPSAPPMAPIEAKRSTGLQVLCGLFALLAMITAVLRQIVPDRRLGVTNFPDPPYAIGAAIGSILIPTVVGFIVYKVGSRKAGLVTFLVVAIAIMLLNMVGIGINWSHKL